MQNNQINHPMFRFLGLLHLTWYLPLKKLFIILLTWYLSLKKLFIILLTWYLPLKKLFIILLTWYLSLKKLFIILLTLYLHLKKLYYSFDLVFTSQETFYYSFDMVFTSQVTFYYSFPNISVLTRIKEDLSCRQPLSTTSEHKQNTGHRWSMNHVRSLDHKENWFRRIIKEACSEPRCQPGAPINPSPACVT